MQKKNPQQITKQNKKTQINVHLKVGFSFALSLARLVTNTVHEL